MSYKNELKSLRNKHLENIPFLTLKKGAVLKTYDLTFDLEEELDVPVILEDLIEDVKKDVGPDVLRVENILKAMCFMIGLDPEFKYRNQYEKIIRTLKPKTDAYVIFSINQYSEQPDYALIFSLALVEFERSARNLFILANCLENVSIALTKDDQEEKAVVYFDESIRMYHESSKADNQFSLPLYKLGFYYKRVGQFIRAKDYWERFIASDRDDLRIQEVREELEELEMLVDYEVGSSLVLNGELDRGLDKLLPLVPYYPTWWNLLFVIGLAFRQNGDFQIASDYFKNVLRLKPDQTESINELALCYISMSKYQEAKDVLDAAVALTNDTEVLANRAVANFYLERYESAMWDIDQSLKLNPDDQIAQTIKKEIEKVIAE
ncbi:MAG: tetratricopeptide repeat protein [Eubacteriales bacterium]|nr:tetratricopeptide repeat protein [Eubacteriales bacterium]